jgi:hypothetical protein
MSQPSAPDGLADGTLVRVSGGNPSPEEAAAVILALDAAARADSARRGPRRPAWQLAARLESLGARPIGSAADLPRT